MNIKIKRIYEDPSSDDGYRVLVDRVWPRGVSKQKAQLDDWAKGIAPSAELRKWFNHETGKFNEFKKRYQAELKDNSDINDTIEYWKKQGKVTLLYSAKDEKHNQAVVLAEFLS